MANPKPSDDFRNISLLARGDVLRAIEARAEADGVTRGRAALSLVEDAVARPAPAPAPTLVNLEAVSTDDIIEELVGRLQQVGEVEAAIARAEAAEARLAIIASALAGPKD